MIPFILNNPTVVIFGAGELTKLSAQASSIGKRPIVIFGKSSAKKSGLSDRVEKLLSSANLEPIIFFGIEPNPRDTTCDDAVKLARENRCDMVIAVGGGSVMDAAKMVAAATISGARVWDHVKKIVQIKDALPLIMVPTVAATGSDFNSGAVITNWETHEKLGVFAPSLFPKVSIIDPELTCTCPPDVTAFGGVDIMIHVLETYLSSDDPYCSIPDYFSEGICNTIINYLPKALQNGNDVVARTQISWASATALSGFPNSGRPGGFLLHWMEHVMSAHFDIPHGLGLSYLLIASLPYFEKHFQNRYKLFTERILKDAESFLSSIGCNTTLEKLGIQESFVSRMVEDLFVQISKERLSIYPELTKDVVASIYLNRIRNCVET